MAPVVEPCDDTAAASRVTGRSTRVVVDLDAIAGNVRAFRALVSPRTAVMAVVKAEGYGHGAVAVADAAVRAGASQLGVATVSEGVELRAAGQSAPILVLGPIDPSEVETALANDLAPAVADRRFAELVARVAAGCGTSRVALHLKVDSGMRRYGALPEEALDVARAIAAAERLRLAGVFTHFADADGPDEAPTARQAAAFDAVVARLAAEGIRPPLVHAANSAAALRWRRYDYDLVRIGIALYGLPPAHGFPMPAAIRPALRLASRIARIIPLKAGEGVSYGFTYRAVGDELAALVPIGYADGYPRGLSNRGWMTVRGVRAPVLGRVCMDQTVIGLGSAQGIEVGDAVDVMGGAGPSIDEVATLTGTISYEIATGLAKTRTPRVYVRGVRPDGG